MEKWPSRVNRSLERVQDWSYRKRGLYWRRYLYSMIQPGWTSGRVKVLARIFSPLRFSMIFSKGLPSKFTMLPSGRMVRARTPWMSLESLKNGISTLAWSVPSCVKILMRRYSLTEAPSVLVYFSFTALSRYRIMAWAPGLAGLSFRARSAGGMGSQSSPAEDRRGTMAMAQSRRDANAVMQMNRWVRFMVKHAPKL